MQCFDLHSRNMQPNIFKKSKLTLFFCLYSAAPEHMEPAQSAAVALQKASSEFWQLPYINNVGTTSEIYQTHGESQPASRFQDPHWKEQKQPAYSLLICFLLRTLLTICSCTYYHSDVRTISPEVIYEYHMHQMSFGTIPIQTKKKQF